MAFPCQPYDPIRGLLTKAEMICRSMSLGYAEDGPTYAALQQAALEIAALPVPAASSERTAIPPEGYTMVLTESFNRIVGLLTKDQMKELCRIEGEAIFNNHRHSGADK